jgi:hypothetical protein
MPKNKTPFPLVGKAVKPVIAPVAPASIIPKPIKSLVPAAGPIVANPARPVKLPKTLGTGTIPKARKTKTYL